ncbi:McrC family protein [Ideonella sp. YS5]|uniref:McrC family protein n=1 Tax=Ideonella sp. YS5 TaxID=3453714 RepID=UPI003EED16CE
MNEVISVREYARLTTEPVDASLDRAQVRASAFDYLCQLNASFSRAGVSLVQVEGRRWLRLDNYVGVLQTPCGTTLEVLPKHHEHTDSLKDCRALLRKMIQATLDLPAREVGPAPLELFDAPLSEWVMQRFLSELDLLVKRGLRFEYQRVEDETPFLRGQLNLVAQMRQPPGRDHHFHVRHDIYSPDRPENRLLRLALDRVRQATQEPENWRLAQELSFRLAEVPPSRRLREDFRAWGTDRLMAHYQAVKPWCELILNRHMPLAVLGEQFGLSLLFPMEKLFERYVAAWLRRQVASWVDIRTPASSESLCLHGGSPIFQLEPDVLLRAGGQRWVLDMKWKRLDGSDRAGKYGLSQADFYQLFAYGHKYLAGQGEMALVFPRSESFAKPLPPFDFDSDLALHVLPFDLDADRLIGWDSLQIPLRQVHQVVHAAIAL